MTASTGRAPQPSPESASFRQVKGMEEEHEGGARAVVWRESGVWEFSGGGCEAARNQGSQSGRWASSGLGRTGLAPTLVGLEVPALTRQPACQLGKLH